MSELQFERYGFDQAAVWDAFLPNARNAHFMHRRTYMDYHSDRFEDHSYFIRRGQELLGLLPANRVGDVLFSHQGLTFGGLLLSNRLRSSLTLGTFQQMADLLRRDGFSKVVYKRIPYIYDSYCAEEDLYALFRMGARLVRRDLGCAVDLANPVATAGSHSGKKARDAGVVARLDEDLTAYHEILRQALERHGVTPVHSLAEMERLRAMHPENIKLFASRRHGEMLAGALVFDTGRVIHTQYLANSEAGRALGALDVVLNHLKTEFLGLRHYLSFGISTEDGGWTLNEGLCRQKEAFGGRAICHDIYEIDLRSSAS